jgi:hypothetical protein
LTDTESDSSRLQSRKTLESLEGNSKFVKANSVWKKENGRVSRLPQFACGFGKGDLKQ